MIKNKNFYRWGTNLFTQLNMNLFSCFERCSALSFRQDRGDVALPEVTESSVLLTCRGEQHAWNQEDHQHDGNHASLCCCPLAAPGAEAGGRTAQLHSVREDPSSDCNPHAPPPTDTHTCTLSLLPSFLCREMLQVRRWQLSGLKISPFLTSPRLLQYVISCQC